MIWIHSGDLLRRPGANSRHTPQLCSNAICLAALVPYGLMGYADLSIAAPVSAFMCLKPHPNIIIVFGAIKVGPPTAPDLFAVLTLGT